MSKQSKQRGKRALREQQTWTHTEGGKRIARVRGRSFPFNQEGAKSSGKAAIYAASKVAHLVRSGGWISGSRAMLSIAPYPRTVVMLEKIT
jgi:hypothetical protein